MAQKQGEIWRPIKGYENKYEISNMGKVKNVKTGRMLKATPNTGGYLRVGLYKNGLRKDHRIHRLVANEFLINSKNYNEVNHIDEDKMNNAATNLEWCDRNYNMNWGTLQNRLKESNKKTKKKVVQFDLLGNVVNKWGGIREAERGTGAKNQHISSCCRGKIKQAYGYVWRFEDCV